MTVEDLEAIREVMHLYCQYLDEADSESWISLFVEEGSLELNTGVEPLVGREALRAFASGRVSENSLHVSSDHVIRVDGDQATAASTIIVVSGREDPRVRLAGRFADQLRRDGGKWRIVSRRLDPRFRLPA